METDPTKGSEPERLGAASDDALQRSHEAFDRVDRQLHARQRPLQDLDDTLRRTHDLLQEVDVDLVALDREAAAPVAPRLLIVDDNPTICDVLRLLFRFECPGVDIRTAASGRAAVDEVPWRPDVVILDWQMPEMDGLATARELRRQVPDVVVIMYSALPAADGEGAARAAGADRYVEKGADTTGLIDAVCAALSGERIDVPR